MTDEGVIQRKTVGSVAILTINRAAFGNALDEGGLESLAANIRICQSDPSVRVAVLTGAGKKFFCSGSDIKELSEGVSDIGVHLRMWHEVINLIAGSDKPVIAALNGIAVGGGLELALACHRRVATANVRVGLPELKVGLFPAAGGVRRLTKLIGRARALQLVLSAALINAGTARELGVIDELLDESTFEDDVLRNATQLAAFEPNAVSAVLCCSRMAEQGMDSDDMEVVLLRQCYSTPQNRKLLDEFMSRPKKG